jgi:hypothetical protein
VNRSFPDDKLDAFVDALATRISGFDKQAITDTKRLVDFASLPSDPEIGAGWDAFISAVQRPVAQKNIGKLMDMGLQTNPCVRGLRHLPRPRSHRHHRIMDEAFQAAHFRSVRASPPSSS